jgi:hypothetical protein
MIKTAMLGSGEHAPGMLKLGDLLVERLEAWAGDGFPFFNGRGAEDSVNLVESQTGVLRRLSVNPSGQCERLRARWHRRGTSLLFGLFRHRHRRPMAPKV